VGVGVGVGVAVGKAEVTVKSVNHVGDAAV
jgi:hypothetical protein